MMKKLFILALLILAIAAEHSSAARNVCVTSPDPELPAIKTLIVDADVTVILVNSREAAVQVTGAGTFTSLISLRRKTDTLIVGSAKNKNLKEKVTIYVPAGAVSRIIVNNDALIRTIYPLHVAQLDVVLNGDCRFMVSNFGKINISGTDAYAVEQNTRLIVHPAAVASEIIYPKN